MAKRKATITLIGPLSLAVGRYKFQKDRPVYSEDEELIRYCEISSDFRCVIQKVEEEAAPKKAAAPQPKTAPKEEPKPEPKAQEVGKKSKPEPVQDDEEDAVEPKESKPLSRLGSKKKKGDGA